ncbi:MAG: metallophosphoesterase [Candidatus Moraniibacteriota bacterium]
MKKYFKRFFKKETKIITKKKDKETVAEDNITEKKSEEKPSEEILINKKVTRKPRKHNWLYIVIAVLFFIIAGLGLASYFYWNNVILKSETSLKIGFTADWEYGYKNNVGNKPTNKAPEALEKAVAYFNNEFHPEIVIAGGDLVESSISKKNTTIEQFGKINAIFSKLQAKRGYVFGNHDLRDLTKEELRAILGMADNHSYFDLGDWRFVLMDTNFKKDGSDLGPNYYIEGFVSEAEFNWLKIALDTERPTILFSHHTSRPDELDGNLISNDKNLSQGLELHNFLKQYNNLVLVASGHEPGYKFQNVDGINYIINGNLASFEVLGNFTSMEAKYNKYTKEAKIAIEKHGERAEKFEIKKKVGELDWKELVWRK